MGTLSGIRPAPHQRPVQMGCQWADILGDISRKLESARQNLRWLWKGLREQTVEMLGGRRIDGAGGDQIHGAGVADETGEEEGRAGLHGDAAAAEDEAVFAFVVGDSGSSGH